MRPANSGPLSTRIVFGLPRSATNLSRTSTTLKALNVALGTVASPSREQQSTMVRSGNGRQSNRAADMKAIGGRAEESVDIDSHVLDPRRRDEFEAEDGPGE